MLSTIIDEEVGCVVLLIPRRIKQIKEEGRREGREEARAEGIKKGRAEVREHVGALLALHDRGEITMEQLIAILSDRYNGNGETD